MKEVQFVRDVVVQDSKAGSQEETRYAAQSIVELPDHAADHWIRRDAAVYVRTIKLKRKKRDVNYDVVGESHG